MSHTTPSNTDLANKRQINMSHLIDLNTQQNVHLEKPVNKRLINTWFKSWAHLFVGTTATGSNVQGSLVPEINDILKQAELFDEKITLVRKNSAREIKSSISDLIRYYTNLMDQIATSIPKHYELAHEAFTMVYNFFPEKSEQRGLITQAWDSYYYACTLRKDGLFKASPGQLPHHHQPPILKEIPGLQDAMNIVRHGVDIYAQIKLAPEFVEPPATNPAHKAISATFVGAGLGTPSKITTTTGKDNMLIIVVGLQAKPASQNKELTAESLDARTLIAAATIQSLTDKAVRINYVSASGVILEFDGTKDDLAAIIPGEAIKEAIEAEEILKLDHLPSQR